MRTLVKIFTYKELKDIEYLDTVCGFYNISFPYDNIDCESFKSFILNDVNIDEDLILFAVDDKGFVKGFLAGVEVIYEPFELVKNLRDTIWVKNFVVDPSLRNDDWKKLFLHILQYFEDIARSKGKTRVVLYAYPPYYFMPGINILYEDYLELFELYGYAKKEENVSYEVNLAKFYYLRRVIRIENKLLSEGFTFRKGRSGEAESVSQWVGKTFSPFWRLETLHAFKNRNPSIWLAEQNNEVVGFSVYLRMGRNEVGPLGVDPRMRRSGIGTVLLFKALHDMKQLGFRYVVIPWTSHLFFYSQVPGIERIKHYYVMVKNI